MSNMFSDDFTGENMKRILHIKSNDVVGKVAQAIEDLVREMVKDGQGLITYSCPWYFGDVSFMEPIIAELKKRFGNEYGTWRLTPQGPGSFIVCIRLL